MILGPSKSDYTNQFPECKAYVKAWKPQTRNPISRGGGCALWGSGAVSSQCGVEGLP